MFVVKTDGFDLSCLRLVDHAHLRLCSSRVCCWCCCCCVVEMFLWGGIATALLICSGCAQAPCIYRGCAWAPCTYVGTVTPSGPLPCETLTTCAIKHHIAVCMHAEASQVRNCMHVRHAFAHTCVGIQEVACGIVSGMGCFTVYTLVTTQMCVFVPGIR